MCRGRTTALLRTVTLPVHKELSSPAYSPRGHNTPYRVGRTPPMIVRGAAAQETEEAENQTEPRKERDLTTHYAECYGRTPPRPDAGSRCGIGGGQTPESVFHGLIGAFSLSIGLWVKAEDRLTDALKGNKTRQNLDANWGPDRTLHLAASREAKDMVHHKMRRLGAGGSLEAQ
ncbi:hypothetical protein AAFF_G00125930 [Aldrovandia affinis]|uniref:Uncharacterized protein n=1 Tax=Aldrovandia affinis TaxID=143900 RepID=A0AAD7RRE3_9TELE|nr:hypothetical protein AAFF_G00125930 [Aldrovandia affinis]